MRHIRRVIVTALLFSMLIVPELAVATVSATTPNPLRPYIILLQPNVDRAAFTRDLRQHNAGQVRYEYSSVFNGLVIDLPEAVAEMLATDGRVLGMSEDRPVSIGVQTTPAGISAIGATQSPIANINGVDERVNVDVAVLDTGSGPHVDLNVVGGVSCMGGAYSDNNGHGTHVAGTVGAIDNTAGVVGVAPGARIWSVKVLDSSGNGTTSSAICGVDWVNANAGTIEVANMSLGAYYGAPPPTDNCGNYDADAFIEDPMHRAICNSVAAGVTYTVAAGNDSADARFYAPARYPEVITVSAINTSNWLFASFSNYGQVVDVAAPGVAVLSTTPGNGYQSWNGTSMATPHAAGAAALYLVANPGASPAAVRSALISTGNTTIWSGDRDAFKEPFLNVSSFGGTPTTRDVEVTSLSATPSVTQGQTVNVSTQVRNNGTASETVSVTLNESPNGFTQNQSINLAAGATTTVNFNWATSTATTPGQHTLQVTATIPNDGNAANNSRSTATNVQQATSTSMSVTAVEMSNRQAKGQNLIDIRVRVESGGAPVSGATVNVLLTRPGGATNQLVGITNTTGYAFMTASTSGDGTYSAGVTNVTRSGYVYDPSGNVVSSASLTLGGGGSDPRDVEVVSISAPANVTQGDAVTVSAVVRNNGTASETFNVTLTETPNGFSQTQSVTLGAGASTTVTFTWQTSGATTPGNHTATATATMSGDGNAANNARSATVNVQASGGGGSPELYVSDITLSQVKTSVQGRVYIQSAGQNVSGATVSVELQLPSGSVVSASATTTVYGYAVFHWPLSGSGTYTVTVTNAAKSGYTYDPSQNIVSSRSITIT